jgi:hypothetical protein
MMRQNINPSDCQPAGYYPLINLYLHKMIFSFALIAGGKQARLSLMIQGMTGTISADTKVDNIISPIPLSVDSKAVCVKPSWIHALYGTDGFFSPVEFVTRPPVAPHNPRSKPQITSLHEI